MVQVGFSIICGSRGIFAGQKQKQGESMREKLNLYMEEKSFAQILSRYHFRKSDEAQIRGLTECLMQTAEPALYYAPCTQEDAKRLAVLVTLGAGVDEMQRVCTEKGQLSESYMIECIALELLVIAYEQSAEKIYSHFWLWTVEFAFLVVRVPIEET